MAVVLNIMSQLCGHARGVLASNFYLLKQCFPEFSSPSRAAVWGFVLGCSVVCVGELDTERVNCLCSG